MSTKHILAAAALTGLLSGVQAAQVTSKSIQGDSLGTVVLPLADKGDHACKGKNECKGKGGCKSSDNGCKGKNSCKGKGGCKSAPEKPQF